MATDIRLNLLDLTKDKGIGIDLPLFDKRGSFFKVNYTTLDQASANARNLLLTNQGERVMQPTFGCDLYRSLFDTETEVLVEKIESTINAQFEYWLPYIFINSLDVTLDNDYNKVFVSMRISLQNNKFDTKSIDLELTRTI